MSKRTWAAWQRVVEEEAKLIMALGADIGDALSAAVSLLRECNPRRIAARVLAAKRAEASLSYVALGAHHEELCRFLRAYPRRSRPEAAGYICRLLGAGVRADLVIPITEAAMISPCPDVLIGNAVHRACATRTKPTSHLA